MTNANLLAGLIVVAELLSGSLAGCAQPPKETLTDSVSNPNEQAASRIENSKSARNSVHPTAEGQYTTLERRLKYLSGVWEGDHYWKAGTPVAGSARWNVELLANDRVRITQLHPSGLAEDGKLEVLEHFERSQEFISWHSGDEQNSIYILNPNSTIRPTLFWKRTSVEGKETREWWVRMTKVK